MEEHRMEEPRLEHSTPKKHSELNKQLAVSVELQQKQLQLAKKQLFCSRIIAVLLVCITLSIGAFGFFFAPQMNHVLKNLNNISQEIDDQEPIDVESLNSTLQHLESILAPLSELSILGGD